MTRKKILNFCFHILFSILLIHWFYNNTYIRPYTVAHPYKEIIVALLLLFVIYVNFFVLIPRSFNKANFRNYFFISLLLLLGVSIIEFVLVKNDIIKCIGGVDDAIKAIYFRNILLIIFLRYSGFYLFFTVLKFYLLTKSKAFIERKAVLINTGFIVLNPIQGKPITININFISYFSQDKNNTFIHYTRGATTPIYSSLNHIQEYLGSMCFRINKESVITFTNVISYDDESVRVAGEKSDLSVSLKYSKSFAQNIQQTLREILPDLEQKNEKIISKNDTFGGITDQSSDEKTTRGGLNELILEEIKKKEGIHVWQLAEIFEGKISLRTIERILKELSDKGVIEFRGSKKTGGYYVV